MTVAVRDLKNRLSEFLRQVRAGQSVIVTDRGRPIAEINPIGRRNQTPQERFQRLVDSGDVTSGKGRALGGFAPLRVRGTPVSKTILDDRD